MNTGVPWSRPRTDVLLANETSYVEEYLWALQNQPPVVSSSADTTKADCASLWPEALYPDLYGKLLDQEQMAQSVRLHSARGCAFPTISTPPGAAVRQLCFSAPEIWSELSEQWCSPSGCRAGYPSKDPAHHRGSAGVSEYALWGEPELEPLFALPGEVTDTRARDDRPANTNSASLKIHDAAEDKLMQQVEATGRKKPRQQRKGRISHRRAEAEIAALSRARSAAAATGRSRAAARRTRLKARKLAKLEA